MVQIYNPNVVGKQILMDVKNIEKDKLKTIETIRPFMEKMIEELKLNVVGECSHQFKKDNVPYGATMTRIYLLAESHLSIHTFVDEGKITLDLFTCSLGVEYDKIKSMIKDFLKYMY
jgi:S-adenosylmethionine decarboxylase